jgi:2-C-methyl-D-erythritol 2,4-cyclodiphosphate synthase
MAGMPPPGRMRTGWGFDAHRLGGEPPLVLGGVVVSETDGVLATSDGDVAAHALTDAVLGAAVLGDMGEHFPSSDPAWAGADSIGMLSRAVRMAAEAGWKVEHADVTVVAEWVRVAPHREEMRWRLAGALEADPSRVSVKATTTDGLGFIGAGEGIAAMAVVTLREAG